MTEKPLTVEELDEAATYLRQIMSRGNRAEVSPAQFLRVIAAARAHLTSQDWNAAQLRAMVKAVRGWREFDWPEGFDRRTAQMISDNMDCIGGCKVSIDAELPSASTDWNS